MIESDPDPLSFLTPSEQEFLQRISRGEGERSAAHATNVEPVRAAELVAGQLRELKNALWYAVNGEGQ